MNVRSSAIALLVAAAACRNNDSGGSTVANTLKIAPDSITVTVGASSTLAVTDANGQAINGAVWATSDQSKVSVSQGGLVTAIAPGRVILSATAGGKTGTAVVRSAIARDFSITAAQFTQAIQSPDGSVPMVLGGNAAAVNVLISTTVPGADAMPIVLRLFDASNNLIRADTLRTSATLGTNPGYLNPTVQFLVPASVLSSVASWQIVRDPTGTLPDLDPSNDQFPRAGHLTLSKVTVPSIGIRFVPIVLTANGNATGVVTAAQMPEYLHTIHAVHPFGNITTTIGTPFSTAASFGTAPTGGAAAFWQQVLAELDLARIADVSSDANSYWMGILVPPAGFNFTTYGGFGYIPSVGSSRAAGTRTATAVQVGWFSRATQARDGVAHELGHNLGRAHAPCGAAANPDPLFPNSGGVIGAVGNDVYSWSSGTATSAPGIPGTTGDLMGYCNPVWISEYNYRAVMNFRGTAVALRSDDPAPTRSLIVRGSIEGSTVTLQPSFVITARPTAPERTGPYRLIGRSAAGVELFSYSFTPSVVDHAENIRHFLFAIPMTAAMEDSLVTISVTGPGASAQLRSGGSALRSGGMADAMATATSSGAVKCGDPSAAGILVLDAATGSMLGTAAGAAMNVVLPASRAISVVCSDGVRAVRKDVVAQ